MKRLFLSIYLTLLASLAGFSLLVALSWFVFSGADDHGSPRLLFAGRIADKIILNSGGDLVKSLDEWADISGFELGLLDKNGEIIAKTENFIRPLGRFFDLSRFNSAKLSEGRVLQIGKSRVHRTKSHFMGILLILLGLGGAIALITYPFVRHLTRRLERLTEGVKLLGEQRGVRVKVEGCDECATLAETFNTTSEKLDNLILSQKSLLANASHELRSPLARLRMAVESVSSATPVAILTEIHQNISELDALIEEILIASRLEADGLSKVKEAVDISALLQEEASRLNLSVNIPNSPVILGETRLLRRLFRNLLENAVKHGETVKVNLVVTDKLQIEISDNGEGVPHLEREKIFAPFYRKSGHGEVKGGVGLGLSLARRIAREHGGDVICLPVESGATFRITLPL